MIVLASGSPSRKRLLEAAGISPVLVKPPPTVEPNAKVSLHGKALSSAQGAIALAGAKAKAVSLLHPHAIVIGADQIVDLQGQWLEKPGSILNAREQLKLLRGKSHELVTAVVIVKNCSVVWSHVAVPKMVMREFSDDFLEEYLEKADPGFLECGGSYQIEGLGITLFESIEGDLFSIQGLPLLPLLAALRSLGEVSA